MKPAATKFLVCPECKSELGLRAQIHEGREVVEGALECRGCGVGYPIVGGVPRFVRSGAYASSFGYQWHRFRTVQLDSVSGTSRSERALESTTGWTDADYGGRLVLDAGVGAGRFAEIVAKKGGEVVGIDLTTAVDAAYLNIGRHERVHLIQADIFAMPFRESTFDLAYSIGVLHHTPDPRAAFERVAATVKKGGGLAIYVYHGYGFAQRSSDLIRRLTTRLPAPLMIALAAAAIPLYYLYGVPGLGKVLQLVCPISLHPSWRWRWLDTFDWYTPTYQWKFRYPEVIRWFRANGFLDIEAFDDAIRIRGIKTG
ncbi:MAG: methyltransferase domain-containing protein [Candidatus Rokubacteria bacterium]|nr:methyltransferase domain-containing protein [Candidatus Rokubacteria bacterium]